MVNVYEPKVMGELTEIIALLNFKYKKLYNRIKKLEPLSVLDLGCGFPFMTSILYHLFDTIRDIVGVDKIDEGVKLHVFHTMILDQFITFLEEKFPENKDEISNSINSLYSAYSFYMKDSEVNRPFISDESTFNSIFIDTIETCGINEYLSYCDIKFDVILSSFALHYSGVNLKFAISKIKENLTSQGIVLIHVRNNFNFDLIEFEVELNNTFEEGDLIKWTDKRGWENAIFINKCNLI